MSMTNLRESRISAQRLPLPADTVCSCCSLGENDCGTTLAEIEVKRLDRTPITMILCAECLTVLSRAIFPLRK